MGQKGAVEHEVRHVRRHGQPGGAPRVIWAAHLQLPPAPRRLLPPHRLPRRRLRRWNWSMPPASLQQPSSQVITCHQVMIHAGDLIRRCHACGLRKGGSCSPGGLGIGVRGQGHGLGEVVAGREPGAWAAASSAWGVCPSSGLAAACPAAWAGPACQALV